MCVCTAWQTVQLSEVRVILSDCWNLAAYPTLHNPLVWLLLFFLCSPVLKLPVGKDTCKDSFYLMFWAKLVSREGSNGTHNEIGVWGCLYSCQGWSWGEKEDLLIQIVRRKNTLALG